MAISRRLDRSGGVKGKGGGNCKSKGKGNGTGGKGKGKGKGGREGGKGNGQSNPLLQKSAQMQISGITVTELDDTNMGDSHEPWAKLPEDMMGMIFTSLPLDAVCNLRSVCKEWNAVFSSKEFVTFWHQILSNRSPWLLLLEQKHFIAYCLSTNTFKTISLSFMLGPDERINRREGSGSGLLLLSTTTLLNTNYKLWVCNPLRQTAFQIPTPHRICRGSILMQEDGSYNVLLVEVDMLSIYFSSSKDVDFCYSPPELASIECVLFYKGFLCFVTYEDTPCVTICSISGDGTSFVPLPDDTLPSQCHMQWLFQYGSSILLVVASFLEGGRILENVVVWQLEMDKFLWKEFARMPSSICQEYNTKFETFWDVQIAVVGDHLCCSGMKGEDVVICNLMESSWTWVSLSKFSVKCRAMHALNPMCSLGIQGCETLIDK